MSTIKIKPAEGLTVRDPITRRPLAPRGETKPRDSYWMRRLAAGDVVEVTSTKKETTGGKKL